ncbi:hypothetical protein Pst134EA_015499 [Puccinia striiformis f. sp. tritici]|uniref:hypothetical protein n=1 Tax=Puccinia striiformis f. sp. tritici TaxID=168172 RepID=UPI00200884E7|nr:hypothetical protein Pst134EA_015499 [Puccinia striiformis f. sp. tritici]KAH9452657.1 hypothetical protein Pst134EB_016610 [Puccinia striiformis f. sp. tritici]KAH9463415.1 hypothetical protein Pst134EA_015499 [Puccinia striiformis f. sp. tritici]
MHHVNVVQGHPFEGCFDDRISKRWSAMIEEFDLDQDSEINEQEFFAIMSDEL